MISSKNGSDLITMSDIIERLTFASVRFFVEWNCVNHDMSASRNAVCMNNQKMVD